MLLVRFARRSICAYHNEGDFLCASGGVSHGLQGEFSEAPRDYSDIEVITHPAHSEGHEVQSGHWGCEVTPAGPVEVTAHVHIHLNNSKCHHDDKTIHQLLGTRDSMEKKLIFRGSMDWSRCCRKGDIRLKCRIKDFLEGGGGQIYKKNCRN